MIQSIINIIFSANKKKLIITERLVYEEFAHHVYSNINSKLITDIIEGDNCGTNSDYEVLSIPIKIESFYDCRDIFNDDLDKNICQDNITSDDLCCNKYCCLKRVSGKKEYNYCSAKTNTIYDYRNDYCTKFSIYNGKFINEKICVQKGNKIYENYLEDYEKNPNTDIALDTKNHFVSGVQNNNDKAIAKNIFSEARPSYFEMESKIRLSLEANKIKIDEDKLKKKYKKISEISPKDIYEAFNEKKCFQYDCYDNNYIEKGSYSLANIIYDNNKNNIFYNFKDNSLYQNYYLKWYTRNYIGFQNSTELKKFKKYFDSNDYKNNSLYKISSTLIPNYGSLIIGILVCVIFIFYIILLIKNFQIFRLDNPEYLNLNNIKFFVVLLLFLVYLIIYLAFYYFRFEQIFIDMEDFYIKILEKYNYRRKQIFLVIGIIIFSFDLLFELIIQNLKSSIRNSFNPINGPSKNSIKVVLKIKGSGCPRNHNFKLFLNKKLSEQIPKMEKLLQKCNNCGPNLYDIEKIFYYKNNRINNIDETIKRLNIEQNSEIIIE